MSGLLDERLGRSSEKIYLLSLEERAERLRKIYYEKMGCVLNLDTPQLFTEKIQWYKLYYTDPNVTRCVDKVEGKSFIEERIGANHTAKILEAWTSPEEVCFDNLPKSFVIKSNCQENGRYIKIVKDKTKYDLKQLRDEIQAYWFNPDNLLINGFCSGYHSVCPKVFAEEYLSSMSESLNDYKFFCFSGQPYFCYVAREKFVENSVGFSTCPVSFYDLNWKEMNVRYGKNPAYDGVEEPKHLDEMIDAAKKISEGFPFIRVDFFDTDEKFYVGEMTFYPGGGLKHYSPMDFNKYMGDLFVLPDRKFENE